MTAEGRASAGPSHPEIERGLVWTSYGYVHYRAMGSGPAVLLLHAAHRSSAMWIGTMRALADRNRCIALDYPGCGDSDPIAGMLTIESFAASFREVLEALNVREYISMGQALGALASAELAVTAFGMVKGVILQNCPFFGNREFARKRNEERRAVLRGDETGFPQLLTMAHVLEHGRLHAPLVPTQEWLDEENTTLIKCGRGWFDNTASGGYYDLGSALERLTCPALLLWGDGFRYTERNPEFTRRLRDYRVAMIPNSGFWPQIDNPAEHTRVLTEFLEELSWRG